MRDLINHGMDIAGGRGIQLGPRNFLALPYQSTPIAITVEGANILTRSLMIFGQGAMRCHPYLYEELQAIQAEDKEKGLQEFDGLFFAHAGHTLGNMSSAVFQALLGTPPATATPMPSAPGIDW